MTSLLESLTYFVSGMLTYTLLDDILTRQTAKLLKARERHASKKR
jgi:hypothetical protein